MAARYSYLPDVTSLIALVERKRNELNIDEVRVLNRLKNWVREKEANRDNVPSTRFKEKQRTADHGVNL